MALKGIKVIELAGLAPVPFCGLILSDFGAKVIRVDYPNSVNGFMFSQQKDTVFLNLKKKKGVQVLEQLTNRADVLIDPYRPGVLEKLGLGPERLCQSNPKLVYARISGYGQTGPLAKKASHDINFVSVSGLMSRLGHLDRPPIAPMNLLGDFAGGSFLGAFGIVTALFERSHSGLGQVIDHSMTEGTAYLGSFLWETLKQKKLLWPNWPKRGSNLLDFGSPFYRCFECSDGKFMAVGALEEKFYQSFIKTIGIDEECFNRYDFEKWPEMSKQIEQIMRTKSRSEWITIFENVDACVTPVLEMDEVSSFEQNKFRKSHDPETGYPLPAPKLSRTPSQFNRENFLVEDSGDHFEKTKQILKENDFTDQDIEEVFAEL